jgi:hypothetical protein
MPLKLHTFGDAANAAHVWEFDDLVICKIADLPNCLFTLSFA